MKFSTPAEKIRWKYMYVVVVGDNNNDNNDNDDDDDDDLRWKGSTGTSWPSAAVPQTLNLDSNRRKLFSILFLVDMKLFWIHMAESCRMCSFNWTFVLVWILEFVLLPSLVNSDTISREEILQNTNHYQSLPAFPSINVHCCDDFITIARPQLFAVSLSQRGNPVKKPIISFSARFSRSTMSNIDFMTISQFFAHLTFPLWPPLWCMTDPSGGGEGTW